MGSDKWIKNNLWKKISSSPVLLWGIVALTLITSYFLLGVTSDIAMFRGGPDQTGTYVGPSPSAPVEAKWRFTVDGEITESPAVVDGSVYFGSEQGYIYSLDAETGESKWRFEAGGEVAHPFVVADQNIYYGTMNGHIYAVDRYSSEVKWKFETLRFPFSPTLYEETLYVGTRSNTIYAIDANSGKEKWNFKTNGDAYSPSVSGEYVYLSSYDGYLYKLNRIDGNKEWEIDFPGKTVSEPAFYEGNVYIGTTPSFGSKNGFMYSIKSDDGEVKWKFEADKIENSPVLEDDILYFHNSDKSIYAIDVRDKELIWETRTKGKIYGQASIGGENLHIGSVGGGVTAFNKSTGEERWSFSSGTLWTPVVKGGTVYVGDNGTVYALE